MQFGKKFSQAQALAQTWNFENEAKWCLFLQKKQQLSASVTQAKYRAV